jgi:hypothetical protein
LIIFSGRYISQCVYNARKLNFMRKINTKSSNILIIISLLLILIAGCATQHKLKKYKPMPCPCEKENKR